MDTAQELPVILMPISANMQHNNGAIFFASYYIIFGVLHELSHVAIAALLLPSSPSYKSATLDDVIEFVIRASLGRFCLIDVGDFGDSESSSAARHVAAIRHFGWIFSLGVAICVHYWYRRREHRSWGEGVSWLASVIEQPTFVIAAYVAALEGISTDLLGWVPDLNQLPHMYAGGESAPSTTIFFFCGNFGIILINSSWINVDGGKRALDMLEKMIEVTMMRGAQSGGVVTFEPALSGPAFHNSDCQQAPIMRGKRSRVVNAKRTVLSKGVRSKLEKDNCSMIDKKLVGWNADEFNDPHATGKRLVRGFFGHTRFATSSKASMDGTHPHQWSSRQNYSFFSFQSPAASKMVKLEATKSYKPMSSFTPKPQLLGVENFVTHNGDFEFYKINGNFYDIEAIQQWLVRALHIPMPCTVDSAAIAGMIDLLRVQGSFALSARYAICFEMCGGSKSLDPMDSKITYPSVRDYVAIGKVFDESLLSLIKQRDMMSLEDVSASCEMREELVGKVKGTLAELSSSKDLSYDLVSAVNALKKSFVSFDVEGGDLSTFVRASVNAFFDNDLLHSTRLFMENAKGSFGLCVTTSMDSYRQVAFAAKGQTLSIAFYPRKGVICFGSEQAAVKAGLNYDVPQGDFGPGTVYQCVDENAVRLDLDDLGGEICLLDWGYGGDDEPAISPPNRNLAVDKLLGGAVNMVLFHLETAMSKSSIPSRRLVHIEKNEFIKPLLNDCADPVLADIQDIPRICANIQEDWQDVGLNRMTAWHLGQCIQKRMRGRLDGKIEAHTNQVDILVTGCEVSLWIAEQFVADLAKCFPKLGVKAVSSNKLLGLFGQELSMPSIGFPFTSRTLNIKDAIIIIVSHSGGTFGPLACSNLMQSFSPNIFAVTSEWDTQVGKQLRSMYGNKNDLLTSRIFSTEVGVRPAEPCSVSVVATHQLLTNIFQHICMTIISSPQYRGISGSIITEQDLHILERCNRDGLTSLERIVGVDRKGNPVQEVHKQAENDLRAAGDIWSEHILENAKAYILTFIYIVGTVTSGYPLISGLAKAFGLTGTEGAFHVIRFLDALIYFWLPQINITILRLCQGRNVRHRMVGRTVVIGDTCPWVAQSAEAFLSKIFACSYSIAGLNVLSGNPADHLVHRHTHRVVRGSLLVCGRPDGRLTALTTLEASTCLAVNQASSIQSLGGTCESITIGHNDAKLPLSYKGICLEDHRPRFLCEKMLDDHERKDNPNNTSVTCDNDNETNRPNRHSIRSKILRRLSSGDDTELESALSLSRHVRGFMNSMTTNGGGSESSSKAERRQSMGRTTGTLLGLYSNMEKSAKADHQSSQRIICHIDSVINDMINERKRDDQFVKIFKALDTNSKGYIEFEDFVRAYLEINPDVSLIQLRTMFDESDLDGNGTIDLDEFMTMAKIVPVDLLSKQSVVDRDARGLMQVMPSKETYFGEELERTSPKGVGSFIMSQSQHLAMELYESRIASMQRFVAMTVMFHQMGMRVQTFFKTISFGLLGYRMDRTHSIMRIATTASPVSGADVRDRMLALHLRFKILQAVDLVSRKFEDWKQRKLKSAAGRRQSVSSRF